MMRKMIMGRRLKHQPTPTATAICVRPCTLSFDFGVREVAKCKTPTRTWDKGFGVLWNSSHKFFDLEIQRVGARSVSLQ